MSIQPQEPGRTTDARQRLREIQTAMDENPSRHAIAGAVHDLAEILERLLDERTAQRADHQSPARPVPSRFQG